MCLCLVVFVILWGVAGTDQPEGVLRSKVVEVAIYGR